MKIRIFHANAGYGHRKVAEIIYSEFAAKKLDVRVEDALDLTPCFFRKAYPAIYYYSVKHTPGLWGLGYETLDRRPWDRLIHPLRTAGNRWVGKKLLGWVEEDKPDVILCTHFLSAELFSRAKREGRLSAKLVVVITDFYPHSFWVNEGTDLYWVMSEEGKRDLESRGVEPGRVVTGGIPVGREFLPQNNREKLLQKWGYRPDRFTLLITSGSFGLGPTAEILRKLKDFSDKIQVLVVCGNNQALENQLKTEVFPFPAKIFGFVDFMPELMEASDLIIAKPGGSTTCESLAKGVPMVVLHPIPGQETRNAALLKERNAAFFLDRPEDIKTILNSIFTYPNVLDDKRKAVQELAKPHAARDLVEYVLHEQK